MTEWMRQWILSVTCGAMIVSILQVVLPKSGIGAVGRLAGGLVLLAVTMTPLLTADMDTLEDYLEEYTLSTEELEETSENRERELLCRIIEEKLESYILDKVKEIGVECTVSVTCEWSEDGIPYPANAKIIHSGAERQLEQLAEKIEEDLGIPRKSQIYKRDGE